MVVVLRRTLSSYSSSCWTPTLHLWKARMVPITSVSHSHFSITFFLSSLTMDAVQMSYSILNPVSVNIAFMPLSANYLGI